MSQINSKMNIYKKRLTSILKSFDFLNYRHTSFKSNRNKSWNNLISRMTTILCDEGCIAVRIEPMRRWQVLVIASSYFHALIRAPMSSCFVLSIWPLSRRLMMPHEFSMGFMWRWLPGHAWLWYCEARESSLRLCGKELYLAWKITLRRRTNLLLKMNCPP